MPLLDLPDELLLEIVGHLFKLQDVNSLVRVNHRCYNALNRFLYQSSIRRYKAFAFTRCAWQGPGMRRHLEMSLEMGASLDQAFYAATVGFEFSTMKDLIKRGANVNGRMPNGFTPLHAAVSMEPHIRQIRILLDNKADLNAMTEGIFGGYNALHLACALGNTYIVKLLLDLGMDLENTTMSSKHPPITPLSCAIQGFCEYSFAYVLYGPLGFVPEIHHSLLRSDSSRKEVAQLLLNRNANLDGGSECSTPREYFNTPSGEKPNIDHCHFGVTLAVWASGKGLSFG